ncbi:LytR/AlgR family response regulator transcription factor [Spirosoma utsteinense]|uniref:Two-component system LytT family response regulator n=1 Tax=Spirosoma utsteinense TaxID=2585773 RepID=A0ABR6W2R1_9BACT|nr:LytTR family DNA-binding domain-containing protein [Spirosoma utsteinense]MBC3784336.1 two-component system LytT family response regulator [Spirosoma utsteinense]MBC3790865.1 two-component system LytT family response regulator [Spirosoma utsteinense]
MKATLLTKPLSHARVEQIAGQFAMPDLLLPFWGYRKKMPMHQIVRLEGEGNYTLFHFVDGSQLMVSLTLKKLESRLSPKVFVRLHKKNIINLLYLKGIHPDRQQLSISLVNGDYVEVSRRKASQFMKQVKGFQQELIELSLAQAVGQPGIA